MVEKVLIKQTSLRDEAYNLLLQWIITGELKAGSRLRDVELSKKLGISRTPIREALLRLEDEEFVVTKRNRSTTVASIDPNEIHSLYPIVWNLEALALEEAFFNITDADLDRMAAINQKLNDENLSHIKCVDLDHEFHRIIINKSRNQELQKILSYLKKKIKRFEYHFFNNQQNISLSCSQHQELINYIQSKELSKAKDTIKENWKVNILP
ncbi:transcriptional regulator, GntR family [Marininema mesophilum]|uniref:Transcriptional regulator, GntR family n=1 Tax=Marininema mesophilum TaxID=1048340 RepID=A0A1H2XB47_9BACL|nr:GntR family transcriptional regulator [Marininema mesophilum]SDW90142.1 transcriptional regulator, GntR family [Marininema mesophilum]